MNKVLTLKSRHEENETDMIKIVDNMFQIVKKKTKNFKKNRPSANPDDQNTVSKKLYPTNPTSNQDQQGQKHLMKSNDSERNMTIFKSKTLHGGNKNTNEIKRCECINEDGDK